jgi:hypothetical protein
LKFCFESLDRHRLDGEEIEEQRAVGTGREGNKFALLAFLRLHVLVNLDKVGGFAAERGTVVNDLHLELFSRLIDNGHRTYFD